MTKLRQMALSMTALAVLAIAGCSSAKSTLNRSAPSSPTTSAAATPSPSDTPSGLSTTSPIGDATCMAFSQSAASVQRAVAGSILRSVRDLEGVLPATPSETHENALRDRLFPDLATTCAADPSLGLSTAVSDLANKQPSVYLTP